METKDVITALESYFNSSAIYERIKILSKDKDSKDAREFVDITKKKFVRDVRMLELFAEGEQLQAQIEDLRRTAEKMDWVNLIQLEQFSKTYQKIREIYLG